MPSLRDIKRRIKSVQNTQKITQAMRMVAAAKVKKVESKLKAARPFSNELIKVFKRLMIAKPQVLATVKTSKAMENYSALLKERKLTTVGLLVITSDRGLAGAYNANLVRRTIARIKDLKNDNINVKLLVVGSKGVNSLKTAGVKADKTYIRMPAIPTPGEANIIAEDLAEYFVKEEIDSIEIITTRFKTMLSYEIALWQVLPVMLEEDNPDLTVEEMIFTPSPEAVLQKVVPLYISNTIYQALMEASSSELAARMSSMAAATKNAGDMIQNLTIVYNKARQTSITQELLEIVSGAEALTS